MSFRINKKIVFNILLFIIFITGIVIRFSAFAANNVFEEDECRLAISFYKSKNFFLPLFAAQTAPPFFLFATKIMTGIFGQAEHVFKLIPFLASIGSLVMFYKLCREYLTRKFSILAGFLLFAVCMPVIHFSSVYKQYSIEVFFAILCLYYLPKIKLNELNLKNTIILGCLLILLPFCSLTSLFYIGAFFLLNIRKKLICILIPFIIVMSAYYFFNLYPSSIDMNTVFSHYWDDAFIAFSISDFIRILTIHLKFLFVPNNLTLFELILLICGTVLAFKDKRYHLMLISLGLAFFAALLNIYPFMGRVALYTAGPFILLMVKPFDTESVKLRACFLILAFLGFYHYYSLPQSFREICLPRYSPKDFMLILKEKYNPGKDIILCNFASESSYIYYSWKLNFNEDKITEIPCKEKAKQTLNSVGKEKYCWLYLIKDYTKSPVFDEVLDWVSKQSLIEFHHDKKSYLIYLKT